MEDKILNEPSWVSPYLRNKDLAEALHDALLNVSANFFEEASNKFDYLSFATSEPHEALSRVLRALPTMDLSAIDSREKQLAFWLNLYNALVITIVTSQKVTSSPQEVEGFFSDYTFNVGDLSFSLDDIEHGILRGNAKKYMSLSTVFGKNDERISLVMSRNDPRVHFAFICAAQSCPPFRAYQAANVDKQLDLATTSLLDKQMELNRAGGRIKVPKLFQWYKKDFGSDADLVQFVAKHTADSSTREYIEGRNGKITITHLDFDWSLNQG